MMRIDCVIVDDNENELKKVNMTLNKLSISLNTIFYTHCYSDPFEREIKKKHDLYILDIDMPEISGFNLANEIFDVNPHAAIVFCTNHDDLIYEAIKMNTFYFVRKNNLENDLNSALQKYIKNNLYSVSSYLYKTKSSIRRIPLDSIFYFEINGNDLYIYCVDKTVLYERKTMSSVVQEVKDRGFIRINQSFLVNAKYIIEMKRYTVKCINNTEFVIPKAKAKLVKDEYDEFIMRHIYV